MNNNHLRATKLTLSYLPLLLVVLFAQLDATSNHLQQQPQPQQQQQQQVPQAIAQPQVVVSNSPTAAAATGVSNGQQLIEGAKRLKSPPDKKSNDDEEEDEQQESSKTPTSGRHLRFEFQRYDGWYNNLANSDWGTPNSRLRRKVAPAYSDGVYQMNDDSRPSARLLSQRMMRGEDGLASRRNLTTIFAFFGQVISSEILMASESGCPIEMHRIKIEKCDPMYDRECRGGRTMPFYRAAYDHSTGQSPNLPREQVNKVTSWIDGSFIYSTSETWLNTMRSFDGKGTLKMVSSPTGNSISELSSSSSSSLSSKSAAKAMEALMEPLTSAAAAAAATGGSAQQANNNNLLDAPMSLFGYPMRNKKRAPLINQMPAHHLKLKTAERMFLLGDPRTNQNPMILAFGILFYRWHNVLAERIYLQHSDWSDEEIFQRARRLVIASLQNIFLYEYLPVLLDTPSPYLRKQSSTGVGAPAAQNTSAISRQSTFQSDLQSTRNNNNDDLNDLIKPYTGYKPDLHPGVSHVFQSAAFRFGHTMIPPGLYLRDDKCRFLNTASGFKGIRLCSTWWNAEEVVSKVGIEQLLMGAASQVAEREDYVLCADVRDKLFGPMDFSRRDLAALNIMRGRDNGLADYNTVRQAFKLPRINRWRDINPLLYAKQPELFEELEQLYEHQLDRIDLYIGGMLESDLERGRPGPLFRRIIKEQFERLRDSDRFWFENVETGIFSEAEIEEIRRITLYDVIINSTLIPDQSIQQQVFQFAPEDPCPQPGQLASNNLQPCYIIRGHSYFKGSELTYALVCATLILIPLISALFAYLVVAYQERKRRQFKAKQEYLRNAVASNQQKVSNSSGGGKNEATGRNSPPPVNQTEKAEKFYAREWLHSKLKRKIKVRFGPAPDESLYILDRKCQVQRRLNLAGGGGALVVELSTDGHSSGGANIASTAAAASTSPRPLQSAGRANSTGGSTVSLVSSSSGNSIATTGGASPLPAAEQLSAADLDLPVAHKPMLLIRAPRNYDLVLQFYDVQQRRKFVFKLHTYLRSINRCMSLFHVQREIMLANAETKEKRQQRLEQFFREAYALTFGLEQQQNSATGTGTGEQQSGGKMSADIGLVMRTSLSRQEFAEALGMRSDSLFVKQMFNCIDKDGNGRISFQEFLDTVVLFSRGSPDDKLRIVFDMCRSTGGKGVIEREELVRMLRSLVDIAKTKSLSEKGVMDMIEDMFATAGLQEKQLLTYEDFKLIIGSHNNFQQLSNSHQPPVAALSATTGGGGGFATSNINQQILSIGLDMKGAKKNFLAETKRTTTTTTNTNEQSAQGSVKSATKSRAKNMLRKCGDKWRAFITELEEHRQDIVYLIIFYVTVLVLFLERFINYSYLSEHMDLRHVMGVGIAITRGSAASLSFCYALLLLSMCRNLMTWIRTMGVREYIPLDSHVKFHKIVAMTALVMTVLHTIGHCVNFYHVTQQPVEHLRCLTKEMQFSGESRPTFFYWIFQTVTGTTGLLLWLLCSIIYTFAHQNVRQKAYSFFWSTHKLYYLIYALTLLHGSSKLTGSPRFWIFFLIPAFLFTIDKIMSLQTKLLQLEIFETECLPSDVIALKFARPPSFKFLSGQWVRVACTAFRAHEFHAFTLTSAPQDDYLSIHVRAQGPWTWKLRSIFDPANLQYNRLLQQAGSGAPTQRLPPRLRIEGPFGGGNQDWYKYEVAVMIGGGIGVTPYASILNDLVFGTSTNRYSSVAYKKVYFIWICPSHRNFEWFIDVLRDVESKDVTNVLEMHIFITQFFHKFDLRTTMLYICENHFQRISNRSLFTGLKAINHFGRPDIATLLQYVQNQHSCVSKVGVFSCGPKAMTKSITEACEKVNKRRKLPFFLHQYENFS